MSQFEFIVYKVERYIVVNLTMVTFVEMLKK